MIVILLSSEIRCSNSGHLLKIDFMWDGTLLLLASPATMSGYGFKGRAPAQFIARRRPGELQVTLPNLIHVSGLLPRLGTKTAFEKHLSIQLNAAEADKVELIRWPCLAIRRMGGEIISHQIYNTIIGNLVMHAFEGGLQVETQDIMSPVVGSRSLLCVRREDGKQELYCWVLDHTGVRRAVQATKQELQVLDSVFDSRPLNSPKKPSDYPGLRRMLDVELQSLYGADSVHDIVLRLNELRRLRGSPELPSGSYPANMNKLRAFKRLVLREMPVKG